MSDYVDPIAARLSAAGVSVTSRWSCATIEEQLDATLRQCEALGASFVPAAGTLEEQLDAALSRCETLAAEKATDAGMSAEEKALRASHPGHSDELYASVSAQMRAPAPADKTPASERKGSWYDFKLRLVDSVDDLGERPRLAPRWAIHDAIEKKAFEERQAKARKPSWSVVKGINDGPKKPAAERKGSWSDFKIR